MATTHAPRINAAVHIGPHSSPTHNHPAKQQGKRERQRKTRSYRVRTASEQASRPASPTTAATMWSSDSDRDDSASTTTTTTAAASSLSSSSSSLQPQTPPPPRRRRSRNRRRANRRVKNGADAEDSEAEAEVEEVWCGAQWEAAWPRRARPVVLAGEDGPPDGAGAGAGDSGVGRARSLTDDDLEELKGCVDLGFGFSYNEIPELCGTLPALELCYSMSQRFLDEHQPPSKAEELAPEPLVVVPTSPIPNWKISCPGDSPDEVKARLKYWAQAVACTVKLCS